MTRNVASVAARLLLSNTTKEKSKKILFFRLAVIGVNLLTGFDWFAPLVVLVGFTRY
jgi:hypothetical protein